LQLGKPPALPGDTYLICGDNSGFFKTGGDLENEEKYR